MSDTAVEAPLSECCGRPMEQGVLNLGLGRGVRTWYLCPAHPEGNLMAQKAQITVVEHESLRWTVLATRANRRKIIACNYETEKEAQQVRDNLVNQGYHPNGTRGVLVLPGGWEDACERLPRVQGRGSVSIGGRRTTFHDNKEKSKVAATKDKSEPKAKEPKAKKEAAPKDDSERKALAEKVFDIREATGKSWAIISKELGLGSPGKSRKLWSEHTGKPHTEAREVARVSSGGSKKANTANTDPFFKEGTPKEEIEEYVNGAGTINAVSANGNVVTSYRVKEVKGVVEDAKGLTIQFVDHDSKSRSIGVHRVVSLG